MKVSISECINRAKAIIFDCDGTLINSAPIYSVAWAGAFALSGNTMAEAWYRERHGLSAQLLMEAFERQHGVRLERNTLENLMRKTYLEKLGQLREISSTCRIARERYGRIPLAVASGSSSELVEPSLRTLKLDALFSEIVTQDQVGTAKPSPEIFLEAARRLRVKPEDCLVFEDSEQGFAAAKAAKMPFVDVANLLDKSSIELTV